MALERIEVSYRVDHGDADDDTRKELMKALRVDARHDLKAKANALGLLIVHGTLAEDVIAHPDGGQWVTFSMEGK